MVRLSNNATPSPITPRIPPSINEFVRFESLAEISNTDTAQLGKSFTEITSSIVYPSTHHVHRLEARLGEQEALLHEITEALYEKDSVVEEFLSDWSVQGGRSTEEEGNEQVIMFQELPLLGPMAKSFRGMTLMESIIKMRRI